MFHKRFFLVEVPDLRNRLHDSYHHYQDCFIAMSVFKYKNYSTFYQIILLLSGDIISLNPGPRPYNVSQSFCKPCEIKGLHFFHLNINGILPKLDKLKTIAGNTKAAITDITDSKFDNSISEVRLKFQVTAFFNMIGTEMGKEFNVT